MKLHKIYFLLKNWQIKSTFSPLLQD